MKYLPVINVLILLIGISRCRNLQGDWSELSLNDKDAQRVVNYVIDFLSGGGHGFCAEAYLVDGVQRKVNDAQLRTPSSNSNCVRPTTEGISSRGKKITESKN